MIAYLRGRVLRVGEDHLVLDVGGVGYRVQAPARLLREVTPDSPLEIHVETQVREDAITLFGFGEIAERELFRLLQTVQGVGARVALAILGVLEPRQLVDAVMAQDKASLARAPGVGSRLATRIVGELRERLGTRGALAGTPGSAAAPSEDEALSALINLGYGRSEAFATLRLVRGRLGAQAQFDEVIRETLRELSA